MITAEGETLEEAERKLRELAWTLDPTEYDDQDEFEERTKGVFPEQITAQAKHAAELGSVEGMHTYGLLLLRQALERESRDRTFEDLQTEARDLVRKAALGGCWGAMDDLGRMKTDELGVELVEMLSFMELAGGDMMDYVEYCHESNPGQFSQKQIDAALDLARSMSKDMESRGIVKRQCDCFNGLHL